MQGSWCRIKMTAPFEVKKTYKLKYAPNELVEQELN